MRILQLLSSTGFHGAETMAAELIRQLHELGVSIDVGILDNNGRGNREILDIVSPHIHEGWIIPCNGQLDIKTISQLRRGVRSRQIDIVHSHKYKTTFYAILARRPGGYRLIATYHNWLAETLALRAYAILDKQLARFVDAAVGVSEPIVHELLRYAPADRVCHIGNAIDPDIFRAVLPRADAKQRLGLPRGPLIGFVGRLSPEKGITFLLRAVAASGTTPALDVQLVIVGDGEYRNSLNREVCALGLQDRVHFLGTRRDTPQIYSALDMLVLPSEREAFPMVVIEAMSCGLPVIATAVGDVPRILEQGVSGYVVPPADVPALRAAVTTVLENPDLARQMGDRARRRVVDRFSSARMAKTYLALYERMLQAGNR